jgi:hypothetical protein
MTIARQSESVPVSAGARQAFNQAAMATRVALAGAASLQRSTAE